MRTGTIRFAHILVEAVFLRLTALVSGSTSLSSLKVSAQRCTRSRWYEFMRGRDISCLLASETKSCISCSWRRRKMRSRDERRASTRVWSSGSTCGGAAAAEAAGEVSTSRGKSELMSREASLARPAAGPCTDVDVNGDEEDSTSSCAPPLDPSSWRELLVAGGGLLRRMTGVEEATLGFLDASI